MIRLRNITPKGLYARTLLIVALPIFIMQVTITFAFFNRHWEQVTSNLSANIAGDIAALTALFEIAAEPFSQDDVAQLARSKMDITIRFEANKTIPEKDKASIFSAVNATLDKELRNALDKPYWYNTYNFPAYVEIRVQLTKGYLVFFVRRDRVVATNGHIFVIWLIGATLLLGYVAVTFMHNQVRSIQRLADAAEDFGCGRDAPYFKPAGAKEVRQAGRAFIAMRQRIKRQLNQRTTMLAGVSHDLRTPITRLKLALAIMDDSEDVRAMKADITEMEAMLNEYLAFVRTANAEDAEPVLLRDLISEIVQDTCRDGHTLTCNAPGEATLYATRSALKRALVNLVSNGFKHGENVTINVTQTLNRIDITVDDDGPGIDPSHYDAAFKPFNRLDEARNMNTPGVGLGLTVVRDVAHAHGGDVTLGTSPMGGLRAVFSVPT